MSQKTQQEGYFSIFFWAFIALLPFVQLNTLVDNTLVPRQLFLAVFLLVVTGLWFLSKKKLREWRFGFTEISFLSFILFQGVAYFFAVNQAEAAATLSRYMGYGAYFLLLTALFREERLSFGQVAKAFVVFGAIAASLTGIELLKALGSGKFWEDVYSIKSSFGHKNILSCILMLCLPFQLIVYQQKEKIWSGVALVVFFVCLAEIFMLRTRGVWLATIISSISAFLVYYIWLKPKEITSAFPVKLFLLGLVLSLGVGGALLMNKGVGAQVGDLSNISRRAVFWENSLAMIQDHWLYGVGPGNWKIFFPKYGLEKLDLTVQEGVTNIQRPHNDYLWVWSEGGSLSLLAYLSFFLGGLVLAVRFIKKASPDQGLWMLFVFSGIVGYMIFSFGDFPLERSIPVIMLLSLMAMVQSQATGSWLRLKGNGGLLLAFLMTGSALLVGYYRMEGEKGATEVLQANAERNPARLLDASLNAVNPFFNMDNFANPIPYFSGTAYAAQKKFKLAETELQEALEMHPYHVLSLSTLGNTYKYMQQAEVALGYYQKALAIAPLNPRTRVGAAELYQMKGQYFEAIGMLNLIRPTYEDPRYKKMAAELTKYYYENFEREQKYKELVLYLRQRNPQQLQDFYLGYVAYRQQP